MTTIEDHLRDGLRELADGGSSTVNVGRVIASGEARLRARRARQLIAGMAAATAVGMVSWYAVAPHPTTVTPAPYATPPMADATTSASFTVRDSGTSVSHWVRVTAVPEGARVRLRVTVQTQGGTSVNEEYTVPAGRYAAIKVHDRLAVAMIPQATRGVTSPGPLEAILQQSLPQAGLTLVTMWAPRTAADLPRPLIWRGPDGTVRNSLGRVVPSGQLSIPAGTVTVFDDPALHAWGVFGEQPQSQPATSADPLRAEVRLYVRGLGRAAVGLLPEGASGVNLIPTTRNDDFTFATMPDGRVWYLVQSRKSVDADAGPRRLVKSISYTDASGRRISYRPELVG